MAKHLLLDASLEFAWFRTQVEVADRHMVMPRELKCHFQRLIFLEKLKPFHWLWTGFSVRDKLCPMLCAFGLTRNSTSQDWSSIQPSTCVERVIIFVGEHETYPGSIETSAPF